MSQGMVKRKPAKSKRFVEATQWVGQGTGLLRNRDGLTAADSESWPSLWMKKYGNLEGYPLEEGESLFGLTNDKGDIYVKCSTCNCVNWIASSEQFGY